MIGGYFNFFIIFLVSFIIIYKKTLKIYSKDILLIFIFIILSVFSFLTNGLFSYVQDDLHLYYLRKDFLIILSIIPFIIIIKVVDFGKVIISYFTLGLAFMLSNTFLLLTNLNVISDEYSPNFFNTSISYDELIAFYYYLMFALLLFRCEYIHPILVILGTILSLFVALNVGASGQSYVGLAFIIVLFLLRKIFRILNNNCSLVLFFTFGFDAYENENNNKLIYKFNSFMYLISFVWNTDIDILPWSVRVRIIELINLLDRNIIFNIIGEWYGAFITESTSNFNYYESINPDNDFSSNEWTAGRFYNLHNVSHIILNYGLLFYLLLSYLYYRSTKLFGKNFQFFYSMFYLSFFNFGWTLRSSHLIVFFYLIFIYNASLDKKVC